MGSKTNTRHPTAGQATQDGRAEAILANLPTGVLVVHDDLCIAFRNEAAKAYLDDAPIIDQALCGAKFSETFAGWPTVIARIIETGDTKRFACLLPTNAHRTTPTLLAVTCVRLNRADEAQPTSVLIQLVEQPTPSGIDDSIALNERLASIGKVVAEVAHELNNPLDGIIRYINLALRVADADHEPKLRSYLDESRTGLLRMARIIGELLQYARGTQGQFDDTPIDALVEQAIRSCEEKAGDASVIIASDYQTRHMPSVRGGRLYQVITNLIHNAIDAMPDGGRLTLTTGLLDDAVIIRVADTGGGLPDDIQKVFQPFYTTKPPGEGTGLGLAICRDVVEGMHGTLTATPGSEGGAVFTVQIPTRNCQPPKATVTPRDTPEKGRMDD